MGPYSCVKKQRGEKKWPKNEKQGGRNRGGLALCTVHCALCIGHWAHLVARLRVVWVELGEQRVDGVGLALRVVENVFAEEVAEDLDVQYG